MKHHPPPGATERARRLRSHSTDAERALWQLLRENFPEARFRRQVPIRHFVVDFASHRARLVIEAGGGQHGGAEDRLRTAVIEAEGYRLIRFWNNDLLASPDEVFAVIEAALLQHHPHPALPHQGGGR